MRKIEFLMLIFLAGVFYGCTDSTSETVTYKINEPIFVSSDVFRKPVKVSKDVQTITSVGKICFYNDYIYMSEPEKGIYIIDNRDAANPAIIGFIELLGNADISVRDNKLYADSYVDLVWFNISDPANPTFVGRIENAFPTALPVIENGFGFDYNKCFPANGTDSVVVGWTLTTRTESFDSYTGGWFWDWGGPVAVDDVASVGGSSESSTGINGSMSKFALYDDKLYTVTNDYMTIFDLAAENPTKVSDNLYVGWNVETLFSYKDNMFMGTPTGMIIYSVSDPLNPVYKSSISHALGCDPVVVYNDFAYITVRSGNACGQNTNSLIIVDVSDVSNPKPIVTYSDLSGPKGLGISDDKLFLCDDGLKIYNLATPKTIMDNQIVHITDLHDAYDLIPHNSLLIAIAADGLYQYSFANGNNVQLLSRMPIETN